jgi:probable HAF family extracellular repeat protein
MTFMCSSRTITLAALVLCAALSTGPAVRAQVRYAITDLGAFGPSSINNTGQVTGSAGPGADTNYHAFRWSATTGLVDIGIGFGYSINAVGQVAGRATSSSTQFPHAVRTTAAGGVNDAGADLGNIPGGNWSVGTGINDSGQVAGWATLNGNSNDRAFRTTQTGGVTTAALLAMPATATGSDGEAINTSGQVAGLIEYANASHAFRTTATGGLTDPGADLGTLSGVPDTSSLAYAINAAGQVTGHSDIALPSGTIHAYRTTATGTLSDPAADLGTLPGLTNSAGYGINALGVVVGAASEYNPDRVFPDARALVYDDTGMHDLNDLIPSASGWVLSVATGINDAGWIVGSGTFNGQERAFLLTPVPEPSSLALAGLGVAGWIGLRRRNPVRRRAGAD